MEYSVVKNEIIKAVEEGRKLLISLETEFVSLDWRVSSDCAFLLDEDGLHLQFEDRDDEVHIVFNKENIIYDQLEEVYQFTLGDNTGWWLFITIL